MKKSMWFICFLSLAWPLLAPSHPSLPPTRSASQAMAQDAATGVYDVAQAASNSPIWSLLFADDFERGIAHWSLDEGLELCVEEENHILHGVAFAIAHLGRTMTWDDYRLEVRVRLLSGVAKIAIRVGESDAGYYLGLQADGDLQLEKWDGADWTTLGSDPGPYPAGEWYTLTLEGEGTQLRAYVDDQLKIQVSDASYTTGIFLLDAAFGETDFDDVWMTGDAPAACAIVPASGLTTPAGIAFSPEGELFVFGICRVRPDGVVIPLASACPGDIAFDSAGTLYFIDCEGTLGRVLSDGSLQYLASIPGWGSLVMSPSDELFVSADHVYRVSPDGSLEVFHPYSGGELAFYPSGDILLEHYGVLYKITPEGETTAVADLPDTGPGASLISLAVDGQGNAYLGQGTEIQQDSALPPFVPPVCVDEVYRISPDGEVTVFAMVPGGASGLTFGPDGALYATEWSNGGVSRISSDGTVTPIVDGNGLALVGDIAYGPGGALHVLNLDGRTIGRVTAGGAVEIISSGLNLESTDESQPALTFDGAGNLYVAESGLVEPVQRITKFTPDGTASVFTTDVERPSGLAFHPTSGDLYVSEALSDRIMRFSPSGVRTVFATGLENPHGIAFGPDGNLYVAEMSADRVSRVTPGGQVSTFVSGIEMPRNVTFSGNDLLVATWTRTVWQVAPDGTATPHVVGPTGSRGITVAPDGSTVVSFSVDDSIYRFIKEGTTPGVEVVAPGVGCGQPGQTVTHTFTIQNTGNGQDGFWLAAESERGWSLEIQGGESVGPIACGQAHSLQVAMTIPAGTAPGVTDTLTLTATSRLSSAVSASVQTRTLSGYLVYLPLVLKNAGE